ncbi:hypothetical protein D0862_04350 [Hortaea werneckii]|uniref:Uncharacterized protein n=1 Tax=Hortaea werneckii TaxID=91943 RepID=A0A3M7H191_HORWE|nr:hypothetical protein D0862_04350 [Hortaea werneckii]
MGPSQQQDMSNLAENMSSLTMPGQHQITNQQTSPLLTLPPELRNRIYSLALTSNSKINPTKTGLLKRPALLQTSHQIRAEATQMWFACNAFQLPLNPSHPTNLHNFLSSTGKANLAVLGKLELQYAVCVAAGDSYTHPSTKQPSILALLYLLAEAGVRMQVLEASTARCACRSGGRCKSSARAYVYAFRMLLGAFRSSAEGGRGSAVKG